MAKSIWDATLDVDNDIKQNSFDWSHSNNLTTQIGRITPVFCDLVPAKTSFRVKPDFALQLMPMVFPIQTRMRASIAWFRYPLRALWKDYKDYVGNFREGLVEPYLNINTQERLGKMCGTGSLGDYLGLPSTLVGSYGSGNVLSYASSTSATDTVYKLCSAPLAIDSVLAVSTVSACENLYHYGRIFNGASTLSFKKGLTYRVKFQLNAPSGSYTAAVMQSLNYAKPQFGVIVSNKVVYVQSVSPLYSTNQDESQLYLSFTFTPSSDWVANTALFLSWNATNQTDNPALFAALSKFKQVVSSNIVESSPSVITELTLATSPWYNSNSSNKEKQIRLLSYAHRAYEGIYNCVYRDNRNNPYYINGEVQYNNWIPSMEGGEDNNIYELRYANWEKDFLTTAVQSPQQGIAPLVGITTYETSTINEETGKPVSKVALVDETGKRYALEFESSADGSTLEGVKYVELENGTQVRSVRNLMDLATSGISIPDLRMVNCYQKFLELNMRKGYSYKDIVEGRFNVKVRYADLLMPEFFGGFSRDLNMNSISQTTDKTAEGEGAYKDVLGSQAGVGYFRGNTDYNIECFCDEESIIMGLLVITPLPVYTQLLPKHFTYGSLLDHFNPEFNNIGFQPISYKEVAPIQAFNDNPDSLTGTFGYQRPWYEYCQRYDQAHGLFRTQLSNFLMHRVFDVKPELSQSFLLVDPEQVTDVFSVTETTDKVYGQVFLDITCKLPVARVAIPRLD
nr:MAG TPA: Major capsid protein [Microviridae sp.]